MWLSGVECMGLLNASQIQALRKHLVPKSPFQDKRGKCTLEDDLHELSHWLVSSPYRRGMYCFGLGSPNFTDRSRKLLNYDNAQIEEEQASILGICLLADLDLELAWDTAFEHNWYEGLRDTQVRARRKLEKKGLWPPAKAWAMLEDLHSDLACETENTS